MRVFWGLFTTVLLVACGTEAIDNVVEGEAGPLQIERFAFLKSNNPNLEEDVYIEVGIDSVTECFVPHLKTDSLVASFEGKYDHVEVGGGNYYIQFWPYRL